MYYIYMYGYMLDIWVSVTMQQALVKCMRFNKKNYFHNYLIIQPLGNDKFESCFITLHTQSTKKGNEKKLLGAYETTNFARWIIFMKLADVVLS